jgi:hypothetical protein
MFMNIKLVKYIVLPLVVDANLERHFLRKGVERR